MNTLISMLTIALFTVLLLAVGVTRLWSSPAKLVYVSTSLMLISSGLGIALGWPGFRQTMQFGVSGLWYLDGLAAGLLVLLAIVSGAVGIVAAGYLQVEYRAHVISLEDLRHYYVAVPGLVMCLYVAILSNNLGLTWFALELITLSTTLLLAFYRKRSAVEAAWKYVLLNSFGMALGLVGVYLIVAAGGESLSWEGLQFSNLRFLAETGSLDARLLQWGFILCLVGLGTKAGLVPMHTWLPDAHTKTPSPLAALISGVLISVAWVAILRLKFIVDLALGDLGNWSGQLYLVFGALSVIVPAIMMLAQENYKKLLAYSSVQHMGLITFAVGLGPAGLVPALMLLPAHALTKSALLLGASEFFSNYRTTDSELITDIRKKLPKTAGLFFTALLFLFAVPPSGIFVGQLLLVGFGLRDHLWLTLAVVVSGVVAFVAMTRHVYALLFGDSVSSPEVVADPEPWKITHALMFLQILGVLALGGWFLTGSGLRFVVEIAKTVGVGL